MTSDKGEPREFKFTVRATTTGFYIEWHNQLAMPTGTFHVIEKSAFDKLKAQYDEVLSYLPKVPTQPYEKEMAQKIRELEADNERLREALEYYSSFDTVYIYPDNWSSAKAGGSPQIDDFEEINDLGETAREALRESDGKA